MASALDSHSWASRQKQKETAATDPPAVLDPGGPRGDGQDINREMGGRRSHRDVGMDKGMEEEEPGALRAVRGLSTEACP